MGRAEAELREAGLDPDTLNAKTILRMRRAQSRPDDWRDQPATEKQRDTLAAMLDRRGMPKELLDAPLTKGTADQAIKAALDGQQPALAYPQGEVVRPFVVPAAPEQTRKEPEQAEPESELPAVDPRDAVLAAVVERASADAGLIDAASTEANTFDHYIGWAVKEARSQGLAALADIMDEGDPNHRLAARTLLADAALWSEVPLQIAEEVWDSHRGGPTATEFAAHALADTINQERGQGPDTPAEHDQRAIETADILDGADEVERQSIVQDAIDAANTAETGNWHEIGRTAFDPRHLLVTADATADPQVAAALAGIRSNSKAAQRIRTDFTEGFRAARTEHLAPEVQRIAAEVAADPDVVAWVGSRGAGARQLQHDHNFQTLVRDTVEELPSRTDLRAAAKREFLEELRFARTHGIATEAITLARAARLSPFATEAEQGQWRAWAADRFERDPIMSTAFGQPVTWPLANALAQATRRLVDEYLQNHPDLAALEHGAVATWLSDDLHQVVHAQFSEPTIHPTWRYRGDGWIIDQPGRGDSSKTGLPIGVHISYRMGQWEVTRNGGASWTKFGTDYRAAQGAAEKIADIPSTPTVEAITAAVAATRGALEAWCRQVFADDELIDAVVRSPILRGSEGNANYSPVIREVHDRVLAGITVADPELIATATAQGLDPLAVLSEATPGILRDQRKAHDRLNSDQGDLFSVPSTPDLHITTLRGLVVGDPAGDHVKVVFPTMGRGGRVDGQEDWHGTIAEAVSAARRALAAGPRPAGTDTVPELHQPSFDERKPDELEPATDTDEEREPEVEAPQVQSGETEIGPFFRNRDGSISFMQPTAPEAAPELPAGSRPDAPDPVAGTMADEPVTELPQVPQSELGAPLSTWASAELVEAVRPDGSRVRVTRETLDRYREPAVADDTDDQALGAVAVDGPTLADPEVVAGEPRAPTLTRTVPAVDFTLGAEVLAPKSVRDRIDANIAAIRMVTALDEERRFATPDEQQVLARWCGWGGAWQVFDPRKHEFDSQRAELHELLTDAEYAAARRSTPNAHYTDPAVVEAMWEALHRAGLPAEARVLEPGCGSGHFIGHAPANVNMVGVELDTMSSKIAHYLYPSAHVRNHGFERDFAPTDTFTAAIGNVPFADVKPYDDLHNPNGLSIHNYFIRKSLALTEPGGYVAVITSRFTSDALRTATREEITELGDVVGAVRLPSKAFDRQAKTDVVTDLLVFRRREAGREPSTDTQRWIKTSTIDVADGEVVVNDYFAHHQDRVLGTIRVGHGLHGRDSVNVDADTTIPLADQVREQLSAIVDHARAVGLGLTAAAPTAQLDLDLAGRYTGDGVARTIPGTLKYTDRDGTWMQYQGGGWNEIPSKGAARSAEWRALLDMGDTVQALVNAGRTDTSTLEDRDALRANLTRQYDSYTARYGPINRYKWTSHASRHTDEQAAKRYPDLERKWRQDNGDTTLDEDGVRSPEPYTGELPDGVADELWEAAYTPTQGPYKKRSHLEGAIKYDVRLAMVRGIEHFNDDTLVARKAAIFTDDITSTISPATSASTIDEAIAISFDEAGVISPERMADLLDTTVVDVLDQARGKMFPALDGHGWEPSAKFLSGNVREKLTFARELEAENPARWADAVAALAKVVPPDTDPSKVGLRPGAAWLGVDLYRQFLLAEFHDLKPDQLTVEYAEISAAWEIRTKQKPTWEDTDRGYTDNWGLPEAGVSGLKLFETMCNNKAITSAKTTEELEANPKPSFHQGRTEELRDRALRLEDRFAQWLWSDAERTDRLTRTFNDMFNSFVRLEYDTEHKQFPGLNVEDYSPYPYQVQAVMRGLMEGTILLDHCVGAGKTLTITILCMEMKRLGLVQQPWIVVPNHLVDQWHREVLDAYPAANVLVATDLPAKADRQRFMGQSAAGDWDIVIVPESKFRLMSVSPEMEIAYITNEKWMLGEGLAAARKGGKSHTIKEIEKAMERKDAQLKKLIEGKSKDIGITFEQTGCDFLFVDEAHMYKNLARTSSSPDLAVVKAAQRASDMEMKITYLRGKSLVRNRENGQPNATVRAVGFATGTPVSNNMSELWVMNKYLRPDLLDSMGMGHIDGWAQNFAKHRTTVEMNVTGTQLRPVPRMAEYTNLPQLVAMVDQFRDVVVRSQIPRQLPKLRDGKRTIVEFTLGQNEQDFMHDLDERLAATTRNTAFLDNALKVSNDGRNASLHPTLANLPAPDPEHDRVRHVVEQVWRINTDNADVVIPATASDPEARGVLQMIFCDRGTPKATGDQALYGAIRDQLVERGMKADEVAFIHDFPAPKDKQKLFVDCMAGRVRVLIGSTEMMSTGVNVQRLLKALHHVDCPYKPADLEQREGRIIRQGNVHTEVEILTYVAERSFDATMWQIVERKAHYIEQLKSGDVPDTMEDIGGDMALSAAQTKAAATGDEIYVKVVDLEAQVKRLTNERKAVTQINQMNDYLIRKFERDIPIQQQEVDELRTIAQPIQGWLDTDRDRRKITIGSATVVDGDSEKVIDALQSMLDDRFVFMRMNKSQDTEVLFDVAGVPIYGSYHPVTGTLRLHTDGGVDRYVEEADVLEAMSSASAGHGLMARVRNMLKDVDRTLTLGERDLEDATHRLTALRGEPPQTFGREAELRQLEDELAEMRTDVNARENSPDALRHFAEAADRRASMGQYPGWTLDLNPTVGHADDQGMTRQELIDSVPGRMQEFAENWRAGEAERAKQKAENPWVPRASDGSAYLLGGDRQSGLPGASVLWTDRQWHWSAWDGLGGTETGFTDKRGAAQGSGQSHAVAYAKEREIGVDYLFRRMELPGVVEGEAASDAAESESPTRASDDEALTVEGSVDHVPEPWKAAEGPLTPPADVDPQIGGTARPEPPTTPPPRSWDETHRRDGGPTL